MSIAPPAGNFTPGGGSYGFTLIPFFTDHEKHLQSFQFCFSRRMAGALRRAGRPAPAGRRLGEKDPVYTTYFSNVAADGYDVTAYFTESKPVKGKKAFKTEYMGVDWHFSSRENLDKFTASPQQYAPQYGGYCAWAVAQGDTASGDPLQWTVHDGKLYLNYNKKINNRWRADMEKFIADGDKNWPAVLN